MSRTRLAPLLLVGLVLVPLAACGSDGSGTTTTTEEATTSTLPPMPEDFSWWAPTKVPLGAGWTLGPCEHPDPNAKQQLCATHRGDRTALVKYFRFDAPPDGNLNAHAARFVADFIADRKAGCGEQYRVDAEPIEAIQLPDGASRRYGFTGGASGSPDTERTVQWAGIRGPALEIISISGYDPGSCVSPMGEGTLLDLKEILPGLGKLILAAGLPGPEPG